ncbi:MAG TPA: hypothetical protein VK530_17750 [Candidatus Acidoferrum sp.]|nr:hypothetical protein [Candidatus Acidoferrum sp.]
MLKILAENAKLITVTASVAADLANKEGYVVEQIAASNKVQLYTTGIPYAVLGERIQGSDQWNAYDLRGGGIVPCVAGGAINTPSYVKPANGGKVVAGAQNDHCVGVKRDPVAACADGEAIGVHVGLSVMP